MGADFAALIKKVSGVMGAKPMEPIHLEAGRDMNRYGLNIKSYLMPDGLKKVSKEEISSYEPTPLISIVETDGRLAIGFDSGCEDLYSEKGIEGGIALAIAGAGIRKSGVEDKVYNGLKRLKSVSGFGMAVTPIEMSFLKSYGYQICIDRGLSENVYEFGKTMLTENTKYGTEYLRKFNGMAEGVSQAERDKSFLISGFLTMIAFCKSSPFYMKGMEREGRVLDEIGKKALVGASFGERVLSKFDETRAAVSILGEPSEKKVRARGAELLNIYNSILYA